MFNNEPYPEGSEILKWVSTQWLQNHLKDENLIILDCQPDIHDYILEHIPGAVYFCEKLLRNSLNGMPGKYVNHKVAGELFSSIGVEENKPVVVYTGVGGFKKQGDGLDQTMVAYSLARFGHRLIYVLDGGIDKWKQENRPLTKIFPKLTASNFEATVKKEYFIEYEEFKEIKDKPDVIVLDARPAKFYEGQGPWIKPGHIPGAVNLPWGDLMSGQNKCLLKPVEELKKLVESVGATPDKTVICSCGTGREATNEFILFKWFLKYPKVKIYEGSFTEWSSYPENPTVTGSNPR